MLDGIDPSILASVEHAPTHVPAVYDVHQARARWVGHKVHADLHITVDRNLTVAESHALVDRVNAALTAHIPALGDATVHVYPGAERSGEGSISIV